MWMTAGCSPATLCTGTIGEASLDVFAGAMFYSWEALAGSLDRLAELQVEWVFPGHGNWHNVGAALYAQQMARLGPAMRDIGRTGWSARPHTAYDWY